MFFPSLNFLRLCLFWVCLVVLGWGCAPVDKKVRPGTVPQVAEESRPVDAAFVPDGYFEKVPKLSKKGYLLSKLASDVYFFSTGAYNNMFIVTRDGVILTDPIGGKGRLLKKAIATVTDKPVKFMIYSHPHLDHIGSAHLFAEDAQIVAHVNTRKLLERYKDPKRPLPNVSFGSSYILNFGGVRVELSYPGAGHGNGNIMIYLPKQKLLMFVDVATPKSVPFKNFATVDIYSQIRGIEKALELDFDTYVAGHLYRPGKREEMEEVLEYYKASKEADKQALKKVTFKEVIAKTKTKDIERLIGEYYEAVAEECYRILKKDWKHRLMGFEAFTRSHCDVWTSFHRTHQAP